MIAPFVPFLAESMWRQLTNGLAVRESVHLCDYPTPVTERIDSQLGDRMQVLREIASLGRSARMEAKLKVRQPLARVEVVLANDKHQKWLEEHDEILREELNVKEIHYASGSSPYIEYQVQPNFRILGPKLGALLPKVKQTLGKASGAELLSEMTANGKITIDIDGQSVVLDSDDIQVRLVAKPGWSAAQGSNCVVVLSTELTEELVREGLARDLIRAIQDLRKTRQCRFTDRIRVSVTTADLEVCLTIKEHRELLCSETLASEIIPELANVIFFDNPTQIGEFTIQLGLDVI
jgi:isoleucyl-tRNA synthetase